MRCGKAPNLNPKSEIRNPKRESASRLCVEAATEIGHKPVLALGFRNFFGFRISDFGISFALLGLVLLLAGCASNRSDPPPLPRPFSFQADTFSYPNDLVWEYYFDARGKWVHQRREPQPDYTHHCFVVVRSARQFFQNARFDPHQPPVDEAAYRRLVDKVISIDPSHTLSEQDRVVIPGYANLREFSAAHASLLKAECGGAWHSYFQRGHWRMLFPVSRSNQERSAHQFEEDLKENRPPVVHIFCFPSLAINHAVLLFDFKESPTNVVFSVYDPNKPDSPKELVYGRASRTFYFAGNDYWPGGTVDAYEIYRSWDY